LKCSHVERLDVTWCLVEDFHMRRRFNWLILLAWTLAAPAGHAADSVSVLQFGGVNVASTTQVGTTSNTSAILQFGAANQASTVQWGAVAPATTNNATIGQGGSATSGSPASTNIASATQFGGSNTGLVGQIGMNNAAGVFQLGLLNGSTVLQQTP
jgi:hypothetical protein